AFRYRIGGQPHRRALPRPRGFGRARWIRFARASAESACDASIHHEGMSGDEGRLVGGQEVNGVRDLIDARQPPQRRAPSDALLLLLSHIAAHLAVEIAGSDGIAPDLTGAELAGKAARQTIERCLGRAIDGDACVAADGMHRGYVDDASGALP